MLNNADLFALAAVFPFESRRVVVSRRCVGALIRTAALLARLVEVCLLHDLLEHKATYVL